MSAVVTISEEQRTNLVRVLNIIRDEIPEDVQRREGLPFTGRTMAEALAEICAEVDALAHILLIMLGEDDQPGARKVAS
jgi:hypothetical protein